MISSAQIRAARAIAGLTAAELAACSGVGLATIKRFERDEGVPHTRGGTLDRVKTALESAGIEFIGDPVFSPGVRLRPPASQIASA